LCSFVTPFGMLCGLWVAQTPSWYCLFWPLHTSKTVAWLTKHASAIRFLHSQESGLIILRRKFVKRNYTYYKLLCKCCYHNHWNAHYHLHSASYVRSYIRAPCIGKYIQNSWHLYCYTSLLKHQMLQHKTHNICPQLKRKRYGFKMPASCIPSERQTNQLYTFQVFIKSNQSFIKYKINLC
jgi:hypothetical protein